MRTNLKSFAEFTKLSEPRGIAIAVVPSTLSSNATRILLDSLSDCAALNKVAYRAYTAAEKIKTLREAYATHARNIVESDSADLRSICAELRAQGFTELILCTTETTRDETLLESWALGFKTIRVVNGARQHVQLDSVGELREKYVKGELFEVGSDVVIKKTSEVAKVVALGANYLVVESGGTRKRVWLDAVERLDEKLTNDDSLPIDTVIYAPVKRESLGIMARPLWEVVNRPRARKLTEKLGARTPIQS